jgi:hypothetical protein
MTFVESFLAAIGVGKIWNSQENPPKYYTDNGKRLHHYHLGLGGLLLSGVIYYYGSKKQRELAKTVAGFSAGLIVDDFTDLKNDLTNTSSGSRL